MGAPMAMSLRPSPFMSSPAIENPSISPAVAGDRERGGAEVERGRRGRQRARRARGRRRRCRRRRRRFGRGQADGVVADAVAVDVAELGHGRERAVAVRHAERRSGAVGSAPLPMLLEKTPKPTIAADESEQRIQVGRSTYLPFTAFAVLGRGRHGSGFTFTRLPLTMWYFGFGLLERAERKLLLRRLLDGRLGRRVRPAADAARRARVRRCRGALVVVTAGGAGGRRRGRRRRVAAAEAAGAPEAAAGGGGGGAAERACPAAGAGRACRCRRRRTSRRCRWRPARRRASRRLRRRARGRRRARCRSSSRRRRARSWRREREIGGRAGRDRARGRPRPRETPRRARRRACRRRCRRRRRPRPARRRARRRPPGRRSSGAARVTARLRVAWPAWPGTTTTCSRARAPARRRAGLADREVADAVAVLVADACERRAEAVAGRGAVDAVALPGREAVELDPGADAGAAIAPACSRRWARCAR